MLGVNPISASLRLTMEDSDLGRYLTGDDQVHLPSTHISVDVHVPPNEMDHNMDKLRTGIEPPIATNTVRLRSGKKPDEPGGSNMVVKSMLPVGFDRTDSVSDNISEMSMKEDDADDSTGDKNFVGFAQQNIVGFLVKHRKLVMRLLGAIFLCGYTVYLSMAIAYSVEGALAPMVFTGLVVFFWSYNRIVKHWGNDIYENFLRPIEIWIGRNWYWMKW